MDYSFVARDVIIMEKTPNDIYEWDDIDEWGAKNNPFLQEQLEFEKMLLGYLRSKCRDEFENDLMERVLEEIKRVDPEFEK